MYEKRGKFKLFLSGYIFLYFAFCLTLPAFCQHISSNGFLDTSRNSASPPSDVEEAPQVKQISDGVFQIGQVYLNRKEVFVSIPAKVKIKEGFIELLLCAVWGRTHETVFTTEAYPIHLQTALLLLGLKPGNPVEFAGDNKSPEGDHADIFVEWFEGGKPKSARIENFAYDKELKKHADIIDWVYTGSKFSNGVFYSQAEGSIITTYRDPNTLFDNPSNKGCDDTIYLANTELIKTLPDEVKIVFKKSNKTNGSDNSSQK